MRVSTAILIFGGLAGGGLIGPLAAQTPRNSKPPATAACVKVSVGKANDARCIAPGSGQATWFKDCELCPEMVVVPRGKFQMGSPEDEVGRSIREVQKSMTIAKPLAVGRFAVTFAEWDACVEAGGCDGYTPSDKGWGRGNRPVVNVNWDDAVAYTTWLSAATGKKYRLLADAEREYVTRAGTATAFWWGNSASVDQANIDLPVSPKRPVQDPDLPKVKRRTMPVDSYAPNAWGLYNVHGNVWEWTLDCWPEEIGGGAPQKQAKCGVRTARGGSWNDFAAEARSASSIGYSAEARNPLQGFRVARELP